MRLPLAVALAHALDRFVRALAGHRLAVQVPAWGAVALVVVVAVSPGLSGAIAPRGTFSDMARQWKQAGAWLSARADDGRALVVPAASFGEYEWGRTIDEPIRPLSSADYAVRDAIPLTPAGTIRVLDAVEQRLQAGRDVGGAVDVLRRTGVRYLVLRNDLDTASAGQPSVAYARSAIRSTPGIELARGFGLTRLDASGERVFPVEVYDLAGRAPCGHRAGRRRRRRLRRARRPPAGGGCRLPGSRGARRRPGRGRRPGASRGHRRLPGARALVRRTRGRDTSSTLTAGELAGTRDYRRGTTWGGTRSRPSPASQGRGQLVVGHRPHPGRAAARRPPRRGARRGPTTAWVTQFDPAPTLTVRLDHAQQLPTVRVRVLTDKDRHPGLGVPDRLAVRTDAGEVRADVPASGLVEVALPTA